MMITIYIKSNFKKKSNISIKKFNFNYKLNLKNKHFKIKNNISDN